MSYPTNTEEAGFQNPANASENPKRFTIRLGGRHPGGAVVGALFPCHGFADTGNLIVMVVEATNWFRWADLPILNDPNAELIIHSMRFRSQTAQTVAGRNLTAQIRTADAQGGNLANVGTTVVLSAPGGVGETDGSANQGGLRFNRLDAAPSLRELIGVTVTGAAAGNVATNVEVDLEVEVA